MKKKLLMLLLATTSYNAYSANEWHGPYTINSVGKVIESIHKVVITVDEPVRTGCAANENTKTMKNSSNNYVHVDGMLSVALAAQAQNKKVMVYLSGTCHKTNGQNLWGIKILSN